MISPGDAPAPIEAAGGVLWRAGRGGPTIAVVHRPAYDDWSLPKGKLHPGEPAVLGALREVVEETGWAAVPGRPLGEVHYDKASRPKRVRYWALRATSGRFEASDEVDRLEWLPPVEARALLSAHRDADVLDRFLGGPVPTWPVVLVRHASAGHADDWSGPDRERPLDPTGQGQAALLADVLEAYHPATLMAADVTRCAQTLAPLSTRLGLDVLVSELLSEQGHAAHADQAVGLVTELAASRQAAVVCSQRGPMPQLVVDVCAALGSAQPHLSVPAKGDGWVLHLAADPDVRLVQLEPLAALR